MTRADQPEPVGVTGNVRGAAVRRAGGLDVKIGLQAGIRRDRWSTTAGDWIHPIRISRMCRCGEGDHDDHDGGEVLLFHSTAASEKSVMREINKLLHKKLNRCLHQVQSVLDLCGSKYESYDDARFAYEGK